MTDTLVGRLEATETMLRSRLGLVQDAAGTSHRSGPQGAAAALGRTRVRVDGFAGRGAVPGAANLSAVPRRTHTPLKPQQLPQKPHMSERINKEQRQKKNVWHFSL